MLPTDDAKPCASWVPNCQKRWKHDRDTLGQARKPWPISDTEKIVRDHDPGCRFNQNLLHDRAVGATASGEALRHRTHTIQVLGFGLHQARGIKSGVVVDLDEAENSIRLAVDAAERQADITVQSLIVNISCGRIHSDTLSASVSLNGHEVDETDIRRVLQAGAGHLLTTDRTVVHSMPIGYSLDGGKGIRDPRGMLGDQLSVDMHVVTAQSAPLKNLELCIKRCHLDVEMMVATPYASGLACLVDDEAELGVACVDFGGGTTTISIFVDGQFVHSDAIAMGGTM